MVYDGRIDDEIGFLGSAVTIGVKGEIEYDDWGNEFSVSADTITVAVPNDITGGEDFVLEGNYVFGDKVFFFKSTETGLEVNNLITFSGQEYRINDVVSHNIQDEQQQFEVRCKKV